MAKLFVTAGVDIEEQFKNLVEPLPTGSTEYQIISKLESEYLEAMEWSVVAPATQWRNKDSRVREINSFYADCTAFIKTARKFSLFECDDLADHLQLLAYYVYREALDAVNKLEA